MSAGVKNENAAESPRVVRKYSNRRLYDSRQSRYITLDELKDLILAGEPLRVVNAGDGLDITRQTLVQVLLSEEVFGEPVFSEQSLRNLILFFRGPMRGPMAIFFDQCAPMFMDAQKRLMDRLGSRANAEELNYFAAMQGRMVRQLLETYAFRALENYLSAQQRAERNMEQMMNMPMFGMARYFTPPFGGGGAADSNVESGEESQSGLGGESESVPSASGSSVSKSESQSGSKSGGSVGGRGRKGRKKTAPVGG